MPFPSIDNGLTKRFWGDKLEFCQSSVLGAGRWPFTMVIFQFSCKKTAQRQKPGEGAGVLLPFTQPCCLPASPCHHPGTPAAQLGPKALTRLPRFNNIPKEKKTKQQPKPNFSMGEKALSCFLASPAAGLCLDLLKPSARRRW